MSSKRSTCAGIGCATLIVIGIVVGVVAGIFALVSHNKQENALKPFKPHLSEYVAQARATAPGKTKPYVLGKVVVVDLERKDFDHLMFDLPDGLLAKDPDEVGTVVQITSRTEVVGTYPSGDKGYKYMVEVRLIDLKKGLLLATRIFEGGDPPKTKNKDSGDAYGYKPTTEIVTWLTSLPTKSLD
jgi:hypothetical protein